MTSETADFYRFSIAPPALGTLDNLCEHRANTRHQRQNPFRADRRRLVSRTRRAGSTEPGAAVFKSVFAWRTPRNSDSAGGYPLARSCLDVMPLQATKRSEGT